MRNFDQEQGQRYAAAGLDDNREDRAFTLGGRTLYRAKHVPAGVIVLLGEMTNENQGQVVLRVLEQLVEEDQPGMLSDAIMGAPIEVYETDEETGEEVLVETIQTEKPDMQTLFDCMSFLIEEAAGRPLEQPSSSQGQSATPASGTRPRGGSLHTVPSRSRSSASGAS